jgi:hypothetical protein
MISGEEIIGEIPGDDLNLLEENYRKALNDCLMRNGMQPEWFEGRPVRLIPAKMGGVYHVMVGPTLSPESESSPPSSG